MEEDTSNLCMSIHNTPRIKENVPNHPQNPLRSCPHIASYLSAKTILISIVLTSAYFYLNFPLYFYFLHTGILPACMYVCATCL